MTYRTIPPRNTMSEPGRMGTCRSDAALVRVNRGSTWMIVAPRFFASITQRNATGWHSAMLEPCTTTQTEDRGRVSYPRLVLDLKDPERRVELLQEVVLLVVERRAAEVRDAHGPAEPRALRVVRVGRAPLLPRLVARPLHALRDHLHRLLERDRLPRRPAGPAVEDLLGAVGAGHELERRRALRAEAALGDGRVRIALDVGDPLVLHVHELAAADGAVRAHGARDAVR